MVSQARQMIQDLSPVARQGAIELLGRLTTATATRMERGPSCRRASQIIFSTA